MMKPIIQKAILVFALLIVSYFIQAQIKPLRNAVEPTLTSAKPFKVLTNGKQLTIQSKQNLKSIMVWTASGHRIVEEKDLKTNSYTFNVPSKEKIFYIMIETSEGKRFTERVGVK